MKNRFQDKFKVKAEGNLRKLFDSAVSEPEIQDYDLNPLYIELNKNRDRYQIKEVIGEGGVKKILRVFDSKANREIAMAQLNENAPKDLLDPFIREARYGGSRSFTTLVFPLVHYK